MDLEMTVEIRADESIGHQSCHLGFLVSKAHLDHVRLIHLLDLEGLLKNQCRSFDLRSLGVSSEEETFCRQTSDVANVLIDDSWPQGIHYLFCQREAFEDFDLCIDLFIAVVVYDWARLGRSRNVEILPANLYEHLRVGFIHGLRQECGDRDDAHDRSEKEQNLSLSLENNAEKIPNAGVVRK